MRTPSGILHVVDFKTDQIISAIQPKDYWDDIRHWELKNNIDTLEFKVFDGTPHAIALQQQNLIVKEVRDGLMVPYVINNEVEKDSNDRSITVHASGAWVQIAKDGYIMPQRIEGKTVNGFIDMALVGMKWKRGLTEYAGFHTMTIDEIIDPLTFLKKIASLFDLEIQYRVEVVGSQITGWYVDMIKERGRETGKEVVLGKDLVGVRRIEHSRDVCTALVGFVKGEGDNIITIEKINNGLPYITDSDAFQRWNESGKHKFGFYTPETEDQNMSPERLMTLMKTEFKKRVNTSVSYEVEAASIGRVFGLAHELINEGDTIRIKDTDFTPKLYLEARTIAGDESFTDPKQDKYVFGDYREIVDSNEELRKLYNKILGSLGNKANKELLEQLEKLVEENEKTIETIREESKAVKELAEKVQENLKNNTVNIIEAKNPPIDNLIVGKTLWRYISNGKPGILKVWNGKGWELLIPDVESIKKDTLEQVNKDIQLTKEELNKKVEEAQNETSGQFKEVKNSLQEVSQTIKNVQNSQGEINKTVSEMKQTNEGFTKSIESLTKKDGEITDKLNTVIETAEVTKKTISEVQKTTNDLKKTTTEITEKAGQISEKLESVEKTQTSFNERVNTVEKNAEGTTASVKKLQETQTEQGKTLTQAATTIQQHSEELKLAMKKKDVEDYVGGLGTVNELRDADFKLGQKYWFWNSGNGATGSVDTNLKYKGMNTFAITVTGQTQDRWWGLTSQFIECQVNEDFVASGYFNTDGKTPIDSGGAFIEIEWWTTDKKTRIKTARTNIKVVNHTWVRAVCTDKAPANAAFLRWRYYVTRNGRLWCAAPMLQRGTVATEFWLHPKDQTDVDKMIEDIANRVATEDYTKKVTELERNISANEKGVSIISGKQETFINETYNAYVKKTESRLEVLDEGILAQILKDGIITSINMSPGKITIDAEKLNINADTMVKWLTAKGIDTNLIRIDGDKITIDKDGVTVKMLDFLFQDEWGTKTTAVSRRNLIADPDFSSVTKKNIGHNDYYGFEGGYGLTWKSWGDVVIEKNTHIFDYEQMVNAARVDMYNYPEAIVNNGIHPGNEYTASAHFRTAMINGVRKTGKPRIHVCCVKFRDNVSYDILSEQKMDFPEPSTFYGEIRRYSFTFKVPTNYIPQEHALIIKVCSGNADMRQGTAICVSGVTLYSGKYASMYNWDRAAAERADGIQPFNALAVGGVNNNISSAPDGQTFDISTEKEVKIFRNIRAMQGINLGGGGFQQWGHIRFTDGNAGAGFYVSTPSGWKFNALG